MREHQPGAAAAPARIVVAGAGLIGQEHIRRILQEPAATLVGLVDLDARIRDQAALLGVAWTPDLESMLAQVRPDGVVIALPNHLHRPAGLAVIQAGVAVLMEKPVANTIDEARQLFEAAALAGVPVLVGHHRRHSLAARRAKSIVESGRLGRIVAVHAMCWLRKPPAYFEGAGSWRREAAAAGGGVVMINLIHVIDDLRHLCGEVATVQAAVSNVVRGFPVEDTAGIVLTFRNGAVGTVALSDTAAGPWSWELTAGENPAYPRTDQFCYLLAGTEASLSIPLLEIWDHGPGGDWWSPIHRERHAVPIHGAHLSEDPLTNQMRHFCDVSRRSAQPLVDLGSAAKTLAVTLAVRDAARTGRAIALPE